MIQFGLIILGITSISVPSRAHSLRKDAFLVTTARECVPATDDVNAVTSRMAQSDDVPRDASDDVATNVVARRELDRRHTGHL